MRITAPGSFSGALTRLAAISAGILAGWGWVDVVVALATVIVVRPIAGWIGLLGTDAGKLERRAIAFFGIRGVARSTTSPMR